MMLSSILAAAMAFSPVSARTIYDFTVPDIDGKMVKLSKYKGKVLVIVNVASKCGLTPQYKGLESMYRDLKSKGVVLIGFPANNFAGQEPGTNADIKQFCSATYDVTFPIMSKISVKGEDQAPIYKWLIENSGRKDDIEWNFAKFVIGKDGKVFKRFSPQTVPSAPELKEAVEAALAVK